MEPVRSPRHGGLPGVLDQGALEAGETATKARARGLKRHVEEARDFGNRQVLVVAKEQRRAVGLREGHELRNEAMSYRCGFGSACLRLASRERWEAGRFWNPRPRGIPARADRFRLAQDRTGHRRPSGSRGRAGRAPDRSRDAEGEADLNGCRRLGGRGAGGSSPSRRQLFRAARTDVRNRSIKRPLAGTVSLVRSIARPDFAGPAASVMRITRSFLAFVALVGCGQEAASPVTTTSAGRAGSPVTVVSALAPAADAKSVSAFLAGWAAPDGSEIDPATGYPARIRRSKGRAVMVLIPSGTFQMGAVPGDTYAFDTERPRHAVTISRAYYMDESEVTNSEFEEFVDATGYKTTAEVAGSGVRADEDGNPRESEGATWKSPWPGGSRPSDGTQHPVALVSWNDARAFADWAGVALPTEGQFERAIRGGHEGRIFPWGNGLPAPRGFGNFADDSAKRRFKGWALTMTGYDDAFERTAPVKRFSANEFGLYDLSGNVWEWCADWFGVAYYESSPSRDPAGPASGTERVMRGGAWSFDPRGLRVSDRTPGAPTDRDDNGGFRCAKSLP